MAARNKAWFSDNLLVVIAGSNPAGGMDVCFFVLFCVVKYRSLRRADHSFRVVLPSVVCVRQGLHEATLHTTRQRVQSPCLLHLGMKMLGSQLVAL